MGRSGVSRAFGRVDPGRPVRGVRRHIEPAVTQRGAPCRRLDSPRSGRRPPLDFGRGRNRRSSALPTVSATGIDIAYNVQGAGPPLVLLHGATSLGREDFAAQIPLFSRAFRCYLPDARGHGRTRWDAADGFQYDWLVDDLAAFADAVGLDTFHVVGFSMGAMTALQFASRQ